SRHPRLRVVLEHVSTREGMAFALGGSERLGCTLTAHHLLFTLDDMLGGELDPHLHCKPALKGERDRKALRDAAFGSARGVFFGSDSAPHPRSAKEGGRAASGVWSAPSALCALATLFEAEGALDALAPFVAARGAAYYGLPPPRGTLELVREEWTVPPELDGAVPMLAGRRLPWRLGRISPS
ncbi:MAG: dihydroorotase, partial [Spirochaetaceae bacterium]|nr:dihydroorotase [Spirochaetaceae bacterium]